MPTMGAKLSVWEEKVANNINKHPLFTSIILLFPLFYVFSFHHRDIDESSEAHNKHLPFSRSSSRWMFNSCHQKHFFWYNIVKWDNFDPSLRSFTRRCKFKYWVTHEILQCHAQITWSFIPPKVWSTWGLNSSEMLQKILFLASPFATHLNH